MKNIIRSQLQNSWWSLFGSFNRFGHKTQRPYPKRYVSSYFRTNPVKTPKKSTNWEFCNWLRFILCFFLPLKCYSSFFENEYTTHYSHCSSFGKKIHQLKVCGERSSGTSFLKALMEHNFLDLDVLGVCSDRFGYKHFLWWFDTPAEKGKLQRLNYKLEAVTLANSDDCLFIVIVRDPYDWLRSFFLLPHHVSPTLLDKGFFHFISQPWHLKDRFEEIDGYNPYTKKPFSNLLELRNYKMQNYLKLKDRVKNYCFVRYEDLSANPEGFVNFIADFYNLKKTNKFVPITTSRGVGKSFYEKKNYFDLDNEVVDFINLSLDWDTEKKIGYSMKTNR